MEIQKHLKMLGMKVKDRVTGMKGVVSSVSFDLYGCVQAIVTPPGVTADGELKKGAWFDIARLETVSDRPVMEVPNFEFGPQAEGKQGAASKPDFESKP